MACCVAWCASLRQHATAGCGPAPAGGLNHWDGARWSSFSAGNGLAPGAITAVAERGSDRLGWKLGRRAERVARDAGGQTYRAHHSPLPGDWISALASDDDGAVDGYVWRGVWLDWRTRTWTTYKRTNSGLPSDWITCLLADGRGGVWVGTERAGLAHLDAQWTVAAACRLPDRAMATNPHVTALARRVTNCGWGRTMAWPFMDLASPVERCYAKAGLPAQSGDALLAGAESEVWIGTDGGLGRWRAGRVQVLHRARRPAPERGQHAGPGCARAPLGRHRGPRPGRAGAGNQATGGPRAGGPGARLARAG